VHRANVDVMLTARFLVKDFVDRPLSVGHIIRRVLHI
jgi:hypothetical protein